MKFSEPIFEEKQHGSGAGIPVLKTLWESFDFSLVFREVVSSNMLAHPPGKWYLGTFAEWFLLLNQLTIWTTRTLKNRFLLELYLGFHTNPQ